MKQNITTFKELEKFYLRKNSSLEIYMPFSHNEYMKKEHLARQRFHVYEGAWCDAKYWEDPDYPFDWTEGEFC